MLLYTRGQVSLTREELLNTPVARERVSTTRPPARCRHGRAPSAAARRLSTTQHNAATVAQRQRPLPRLTVCRPPAPQRVQMTTQPELEQEKRDQMDAVLFKTKGGAPCGTWLGLGLGLGWHAMWKPRPVVVSTSSTGLGYQA
eukprot:scaffold89081_cov69-Phaeocystis_antarctica.AAC.5